MAKTMMEYLKTVQNGIHDPNEFEAILLDGISEVDVQFSITGHYIFFNERHPFAGTFIFDQEGRIVGITAEPGSQSLYHYIAGDAVKSKTGVTINIVKMPVRLLLGDIYYELVCDKPGNTGYDGTYKARFDLGRKPNKRTSIEFIAEWVLKYQKESMEYFKKFKSGYFGEEYITRMHNDVDEDE